MIHDGEAKKGTVVSTSLSGSTEIAEVGLTQLPSLILRAGDDASNRFLEFFAVTIRNRNTREAYAQAIGQFCQWCEGRRLKLDTISPIAISTYIEALMTKRSAPTVKQHLAAIRMLFDWLVFVPCTRQNSIRPTRA